MQESKEIPEVTAQLVGIGDMADDIDADNDDADIDLDDDYQGSLFFLNSTFHRLFSIPVLKTGWSMWS